MFRFYFDNRILVGFMLALTILSWLAISSYRNTKQLISSSNMVAHTQEVLFHTERVMAIATGIEIGQRGYSLTGDERSLEPYNKANNEVEVNLSKLLQLTSDNPRQRQRVKQLSETIHQLMAFSAEAVQKRKESFDAA